MHDVIIREARIVVLPELQGHGLGPKISEKIGEKYLENEFKYNTHCFISCEGNFLKFKF